jgi:hypothetical protein
VKYGTNLNRLTLFLHIRVQRSGELRPNGAATGKRSRGNVGNTLYFNAYAPSPVPRLVQHTSLKPGDAPGLEI